VFRIVPAVRGAVTRIWRTVGVPTGIVKLKQRRKPGKGTQLVLLTKRKLTPAGSRSSIVTAVAGAPPEFVMVTV
jgi:hypothetical protein